MSHSYSDRKITNTSCNKDIGTIIETRFTRRHVLKAAGVFATLAVLPAGGCATQRGAGAVGFSGIPVSTDDVVHVASGYSAAPLYKWGDSVGHASGSPAFKPDGSNTADEQALQAGMHHDGIHYFPLPYGARNSEHGLLVVNHEYTDDGLLHGDGFANWSAAKVRKAQHAHGLSVVELRFDGEEWRIVRPSRYARRVTALTPIRISGPAAGAESMRTAADPSGRMVLGTFNNCANGYTPWGTYLTCEENWDQYFVNTGGITLDQKRNGITAKGRGYRWNEFDERFDAGKHPNEPNRHGWVVEFDPYDPAAVPVKRTALGRFSHEGAWTTLAADDRLVVYLGDDRAFEYIYKFVSANRVDLFDSGANSDLLDEGTLYVARFSEDGTGTWLPLTHGMGPLTPARGFADQADVLVRTRAAADAVGATKMDRPEWIAVHPVTKEAYCTLTNNTARGNGARPAISRSNPRPDNVFGHIIRWREARGDSAALSFAWDIFALAGDPKHPEAQKRGSIKGDAFGSPDGLWFDPNGRLWIQTDVSASTLNKGHYARLGNNQMLCADPVTGEVRRFLTGPRGCEITGITMTPDVRTMFVNVQHPGESPRERSDPDRPKAISTWPDGDVGGRPRSATIVIRKNDGGIIGT